MQTLVIRVVSVNRDLGPEKVISMGRQLEVDWRLVKTMPRGGYGRDTGVGVEFFRPDRFIRSDEELTQEYEGHDLISDPYAAAAANRAEPAFADEHPNATLWRDQESGLWIYMMFFTNDAKARCLTVSQVRGDWGPQWYFSGRYKRR